MKTKKKANIVLKLLKDTPDGTIRDADTILADLMENADFCQSGTAAEVIRIYKQSKDKKTVKCLFEFFTDTSFDSWLDQCVKQTTRSE